MYSKVYANICSVIDRQRFILKNCYVEYAVKVQIEASIKELSEAIDILDGKEKTKYVKGKVINKIKKNRK